MGECTLHALWLFRPPISQLKLLVVPDDIYLAPLMFTVITYSHRCQCRGKRNEKRERCVFAVPVLLRLADLVRHQYRSETEVAAYEARQGQKNWGRWWLSSPEWAEPLASSSLLTWLMQLQHTLGELINFKAGWVSKVNDLIIFPASLLRSQLSGGSKWGCGPLWHPRHVTVCLCVSACVCVVAYSCLWESSYRKRV